MITLRDYQQKAVTEIRSAFRKHDRVLYQAPTGAGKGILVAYIASSANSKKNSIKILAHRREICEQLSENLDKFGIKHGLIMPGHRYTDDNIQIGMIQTCARRVNILRKPTIFLIDEAHRSTSNTYMRLIKAWEGAKILGVTATPCRLSGRPLGDVFQHLIVGPHVRKLIDEGYLADFSYLAPPEKVNLDDVHTKEGDYSIDELSEVMENSVITGDAVDHYKKYLDGKPTVVFCVVNKHAEHVAGMFAEAGYRAGNIDGTMDKHQRKVLLDGLRNGTLDILTSSELISEGVDIPAIEGVILLRPTKSLTVFLQQVGRALRIKQDGSRAIILDHVGNCKRLGLPDDVRKWSLDEKPKSESNIRTCKKCFKVVDKKLVKKVMEECQAQMPIDMLGHPEDTCGLTPEPTGETRAPPKAKDGNLTIMERANDWTQGIDILLARGEEWKALLAHAGTDINRLKQVARARGYHHNWVNHIIKAQK